MDDGAATPRAEAAGHNRPALSVGELSQLVKRMVEGEFDHVRVRGEISGFKRAASGHLYFALKDADAVLDAVCWKGTAGRLAVRPEDGMEVIATGRLTTYPGRSKYQIVVEALDHAGEGALLKLLEERRRKLAAEGLFDEARKKKPPFLPEIIGVVTSPTGAVIRDMLHGFAERFPTRVVVWPVRVQGETCQFEVSAAIHGFNALIVGSVVPRPDLIIVARGGGSLEDLWGFNEEIVARAVAASTIPLISAVGHETDWTIIDLVADHRAPTPTAAAERAVPVRAELVIKVSGFGLRAVTRLRHLLEAQASLLAALARGLPRKSDILLLPRQRFDGVASRLGRALHANAHAHRVALTTSAERLRPHLVRGLARGAREQLTGFERGSARVAQALDVVRADQGVHGVVEHRAVVAQDAQRVEPRQRRGVAAPGKQRIECNRRHQHDRHVEHQRGDDEGEAHRLHRFTAERCRKRRRPGRRMDAAQVVHRAQRQPGGERRRQHGIRDPQQAGDADQAGDEVAAEQRPGLGQGAVRYREQHGRRGAHGQHHDLRGGLA